MVKIISLIILIFIGATFCTVNREEITLRYFFGWQTGPFPLFLLILVSLAAGMLVGLSVGWGERRKLRSKERDLGEQAKALEEEIETLSSKKGILAPSPKSPEDEKSSVA